jgi:hypothetical protein
MNKTNPIMADVIMGKQIRTQEVFLCYQNRTDIEIFLLKNAQKVYSPAV